MKATKFQAAVQEALGKGRSLLLVAPTGLGKTFAVTGDLQEDFCKTVYAVPLRALGGGIQRRLGISSVTGNSFLRSSIMAITKKVFFLARKSLLPRTTK